MSKTLVTPQILIIGAGPVGVPIAIGLKRQGYDVLLVERVPAIGRLFKGEYLQPSANRLLSRLGLSEVFNKPSSARIRELRFRDLDEHNDVQSDLFMHYPDDTFALSISHHDLLAALWEHARTELKESFWTGVTLKPENESSGGFFEAPIFSTEHPTLGAVRVAPKWVIGCDGRMSTVRAWMGGPKAPRTAPVTWFSGEEFIVGAEIRQRAPIQSRYEVIRSFEAGTVSAFSLGQMGQRLYFGSQNTEGNLNIDRRREINSIIDLSRPFVDLDHVDEKTPIVAFPSYTANFDSASRGCFLLAGDACNVTTPYGGQGMTSGFEHAQYLIEEFDFAKPNEFHKRRYANQVEDTFTRISLLNFGLYYLFFARAPMFKSTSAYVINTWEANPALKERVVRLFGGLDTDQPRVLELMKLWGLSPRVATSRLIPQRLVQMMNGK